MLNVWNRRKRYPKGTMFASTLLDAALLGAPDFAPAVPNFVQIQKAKQDSPPVLHWNPDSAWLKRCRS